MVYVIETRLHDEEAKKALNALVECLDPGETALVRVTRIDLDVIALEVVPEGDVLIDDIALGLLPED